MANLVGNDIAANYKGILNLGAIINENLAAAPGYKAITDGDGNTSPLQLATDAVKVAGTLNVDANVFASTVFSNVISASGTAGSGYFEGAFQSATPAGKSNFTTLWFDSAGKISWRPGTSFTRTLDMGTPAGNVTYTFPNVSSTMAVLGTAQTFTAAQTITAGGVDGITVRQQAGFDGIAILGRAGGTNSFRVRLTTDTLGAARVQTLPDLTGLFVMTDQQFNSNNLTGIGTSGYITLYVKNASNVLTAYKIPVGV